MAPRGVPLASEVLELPDSLEAVEAHYRGQGWTDGLPIVPPTEARVRAMLGGIAAEPDHVVGKIPPLWAEATVEKVAVNAVMAGCAPEAMPVLVAALEAMLEPPFNLYGVQATTHPVAPLVIVHGPAVERLGMHAGPGVFGQSFFSVFLPNGAEFQVNTYTTGVQSNGAVAVAPDNSFVVVWRSDGEDGSGGGVFGRRFAPDGVPLCCPWIAKGPRATRMIPGHTIGASSATARRKVPPDGEDHRET